MNLFLQYIKILWRAFRQPWLDRKLAKKYPHSVFYSDVFVDDKSILCEQNVLFENVKLCHADIGRHTYIQKNSTVSNCKIGAFCSIASNVTIGVGQHPIDHVSTHPAFFAKDQPLVKTFSSEDKVNAIADIIIENDVWIGHGAIVLDGVHIANGAIIAAGAVVTKDVSAYAVVGGVPARLIKYRFDKETCHHLEASQWWNRSDEWLLSEAGLFSSPAKALKKWSEMKR